MRLEARKCADDFDCFYPPDNFCGRGQCTDQMVATDLTIHDAVSMYLLDESMGKRRYGPIDSWDTSDVTDMSELFCSKGCTVYMDHSKTFNADLSKWDTSRVTTMARMFAGTQKFDGDLSSWDTSKVSDFQHMFDGSSYSIPGPWELTSESDSGPAPAPENTGIGSGVWIAILSVLAILLISLSILFSCRRRGRRRRFAT